MILVLEEEEEDEEEEEIDVVGTTENNVETVVVVVVDDEQGTEVVEEESYEVVQEEEAPTLSPPLPLVANEKNQQQTPTPAPLTTLSYGEVEEVNYTSSSTCINTPDYKDVYGDTCEQYELGSNFPQYCIVYGDDGGEMSPNLHCCVCKQVLMRLPNRSLLSHPVTTDELPTLRPSQEPTSFVQPMISKEPTSSPVIVTNSPTLSPTTIKPITTDSPTKRPTSNPVTNRPTKQPTVSTCILIQTGTNVYDGGYIDVTLDIGTGYGYYPISTPGKRYTEGEVVVDECFTSIIEGLRVTTSRTINPDAWVGSILYSKSMNGNGEYIPFTCVDSCDLFASNLATSIVVDGDEYDSEETMARCTNGNVCTLLSDEVSFLYDCVILVFVIHSKSISMRRDEQ